LVRGMWTVDQIPAGRLIAPLVVLDAKASARSNPDYEISVEDIARWEQANGQIPLGAVVMARTGWDSRWNSARNSRNADAAGVMHFPGYSEDAARFLAEGRNALGLGIDTPSLHHGSAKNLSVNQYTSAHGLYVLTNVANLDRMPESGAIAMVAPMKVTGGSAAPVRILALVKLAESPQTFLDPCTHHMKKVVAFAVAVALRVSAWLIYSKAAQTRREAHYREAIA